MKITLNSMVCITGFVVIVVTGFIVFEQIAEPDFYLEGDYLEWVDSTLIKKIYQGELQEDELQGVLEKIVAQEQQLSELVKMEPSPEEIRTYAEKFWTDPKIQKKLIQLRLDVMIVYQDVISPQQVCRIYTELFSSLNSLFNGKQKLELLLQEEVEENFRSDLVTFDLIEQCRDTAVPFYGSLWSYDKKIKLLKNDERKYVIDYYVEALEKELYLMENTIEELQEELPKPEVDRLQELVISIEKRIQELQRQK